VVAAVALGLLLPGTAGAATSPFTWGPGFMPDRVAPVGSNSAISLNDVSCPSSALCVAVDSLGNVVTSTNPTALSGQQGAEPGSGATWTPLTIDPGVSLNGVSCPSTGLCVAVGTDGSVAISTDPTDGSSANWTVTQVDGAALNAVSCPSMSLCALVDDNGNVLTSTTPATAPNWVLAAADPGASLRAISCTPAGELCVAADDAGSVVSSTDPTGGAATWTVNDIDPGSGLAGVSCPSTTLCLATNNQSNVFTSIDPADGPRASWTVKQLPFGGGPIYCTTAPLCLVGGRDPQGSTNPAADSGGGPGSGATWTSFSPGTFNDTRFTCAADTSLCEAVDSFGSFAASTSPTALNGTQWGGEENINGAHFIDSLSCVAGGFCAAIDYGGDAVTTSNAGAGPGATWTGQAIDAGYTASRNELQLNGISCASAQLCLAVDNNGDALTTDNGGSTWTGPTDTNQNDPSPTIDGTNYLASVSCPSTGLCVAVDNVGNILSTTDPVDGAPGGKGATWTSTNVDGGIRLLSVSCPSTSLCLIAAGNGDVITSTNPTDASPTWTVKHAVDPQFLGSVSCVSVSSSTTCAATSSNNIYMSTDPQDGASATWTLSESARGVGDGGVTCATLTLCVGVTEGGGAVATDDGGSTWTVTSIDRGLSGTRGTVSCFSATQCLATGNNGFAALGVTGQTPQYQLRVSLSGAGSGSVTSDVGSIDCPGECADTYASGATVNLTAHPASGSQFTGWSGGCSGTTTSCQVAVADAASVTATFQQAPATAQTGNPSLFFSAPAFADRATPLRSTNALDAISCPSPSLCVAVDDEGQIISTTTPSTTQPWPQTIADPGNQLQDLSCPASNLCVAVDQLGNIVTSVDPGAGPGALWTVKDADPGGRLHAISCPSTTLCVAVDSIHTVISTDPSDGASAQWTVSAPIETGRFGFADISCGSSSLCMIVDANGDAWTSTNPTSASSWSSAHVVSGNSTLLAVSCTPAADLCVAVDSGSAAYYTTDPASGASATWTSEGSIANSFVYDIDCPSSRLCVAGDNNGDILSSKTPTVSSSWATNTSVDGNSATDLYYVDGVSCPTTSFCVVSGPGTAASSDPGDGASATWSGNANADGANGLAAVSCASSSLCVAVSEGPSAASTTDPGAGPAATWRSATVDPGQVFLDAVSCANGSPPLCVAVDNNGNAVTTNNGTSWTSPQFIDANELNGVACASNQVCLAVDNKGNLITTTNGGSQWSSPMDIDGTTSLTGVACASVTVCAIVDAAGHALISTDANAATPTWHSQAIDGRNQFTAISCATSLCAATDGTGNILTTADPGDGATATWTLHSVDPGASFRAISCPSASFCAAVDDNGNTVTSSDPPTTASWFANPVNANAFGLYGIACPSSSLCLIGDNSGLIWTGTGTASGTAHTLSVAAIGTGTGTLSVSDSHGAISCPGHPQSCWKSYTSTDQVTITATADPGSTFTGWTGACSGTSTCHVTVGTADKGVSAMFVAPPHRLTISRAGTGSGAVTSSPTGINCGATCSHQFDGGTAVVLSVVAAPTSQFTGWSGGGCSGTGPCAVTMSTDQTVKATFARVTAREMFVPNYKDQTISVLSTATNKVVNTINVGSGGPWLLAVSPNGKTLYDVNYDSNQLIAITLATGARGTPITLPGGTSGNPYQLAVTPNGKTAYVAESGTGTLVPVNLATGTAGTPISLGANSEPYSVAATPNGKTAYVAASKSNQVVPVSIATGKAGKAIAVTSPDYLSLTPNGQTLWVQTSGGHLVPISTATNKVGAPIIGLSTADPFGLAISPSGTTAFWTDDHADTVYPVNLATRKVAKPISVGGEPEYPILTPNGKTLYTSNYTGDSLAPISVATGVAGAAIAVGGGPGQPAIVPNQGPKAAFKAKTTGLKLTFTAAGSSDPDGKVAKYVWSFGDGKHATTTSPVVTHTYAKAGSYVVTLTVTDNEGCSTSQVFTGQELYCTGSPAAVASHKITATRPAAAADRRSGRRLRRALVRSRSAGRRRALSPAP
jgi:YVTN family beta-propeller protein